MLTQSDRLEKFGFPVVETSVAGTNPARTSSTVSLWNHTQKKPFQMKLFYRNLLHCAQNPSAVLLTSTDCTASYSADSQESYSLTWSWSQTELVSVQQRSTGHLHLQRTQHRIKLMLFLVIVWWICICCTTWLPEIDLGLLYNICIRVQNTTNHRPLHLVTCTNIRGKKSVMHDKSFSDLI